MDTLTLLLDINKKLDLLLKMHGITQDTTASKGSEEDDYELGRELARQVGRGRIRSDE